MKHVLCMDVDCTVDNEASVVYGCRLWTMKHVLCMVWTVHNKACVVCDVDCTVDNEASVVCGVDCTVDNEACVVYGCGLYTMKHVFCMDVDSRH